MVENEVPQTSHQPLSPTTTLQEDITTASQRRVNLIWEYTQAIIAIMVVAATMVSGLYNVFRNGNQQIPNVIGVAFGMVVGSYFQRTNHMNVGGIGYKPEQKYIGR